MNSACPAFASSRSGRIVRFAAGLSIACGIAVLAGWALDIDFLRRFVPGFVTMNPATAVGFILAGMALWPLGEEFERVRRLPFARVCAFAVLAIGFLKLLELMFGVPIGIDRVLFPDKLAAGGTAGFPSRMAPNTALNFFLTGGAFLLIDFRGRGGWWPAQWLCLAVMVSAFVAIEGYAYSTKSFYIVGAYIPMALHTALAFLAVVVGILYARPDRGIMAVVTSACLGGVTARRLLPAAVGIPVLLGWLRLMGERAGYVDMATGTSLLVAAVVVTLGVMIWTTARTLSVLDLERRVAAEAAERANAAKSEFLSRTSHELRTPLNAIIGFGQLLAMNDLCEDDRASVDQILRGGRHLLELVNEVLDLAAIDAGRLSLSAEPIQLTDVVREAIAMLVPLAQTRGIRFDNGLTPRFVFADQQRLKQILLNLLSNAVKYSRAGSTICLAHGTTAGADRVRIEVADSGPGISPEGLAKLFQPFERLDAGEKGIEGTGIGLTITRRLVNLMGGEIGAHSTPGEGSTFWIELPAAEDPVQTLAVAEAEAAAPAAPAPPEPLPAVPPEPLHTVLYIEDNLANLRLIERILERHQSLALISAMQGSLGLEMARARRPDLILLDLHLPDMPGDEVLAHLRAEPETRAIPVIIISADANPRQIERLKQAGATEYLTKPLDVKRLLEVLEGVVG